MLPKLRHYGTFFLLLTRTFAARNSFCRKRDLLQPTLPKSVGLEVIIPVETFPEMRYFKQMPHSLTV